MESMSFNLLLVITPLPNEVSREGQGGGSLYFFLNLITIPLLATAADEVADEAGEEELGAEQHHGQGEVEVGRIGDQTLRDAAREGV